MGGPGCAVTEDEWFGSKETQLLEWGQPGMQDKDVPGA